MFRPRAALILPLLSALSFPLTTALPTVECPLLGAPFSYDFDLSASNAFQQAKSDFPDTIEALFKAGLVDPSVASFAINVFSTSANESLYSYYHTAPDLPDGTLTAGELNDETIFRVGSVSKLFTAYALLVEGGIEVMDKRVTDILPELIGNADKNPLTHIVWEDITVGALMSHMAGTGGVQFMKIMRDRKQPTEPPFQAALYSDAGYAMVGRILERLTGVLYGEALQNNLAKPLGLNSTTTVFPEDNGSLNAIILQGDSITWNIGNQVSAPSGGVYSNGADLRALGLSILNHELLSPETTRQWMKPRAHTSSLAKSVGAPWEIERLALPVSPGSNRTRISDLYTKAGGNGDYTAVIALSADHGLGYSVLVAGATASSDRWYLRATVGEAFVTAAEHAGLENAAANFAGTFVEDSTEGTNITLTVTDDHPGIGVESFYVGGKNNLANVTVPTGLPEESLVNYTVRLYPSGLTKDAADGVTTMQYRAAGQIIGRPRAAVEGGVGMFDDACITWMGQAFYSGNNGVAIDEFVLRVKDGRVESVSWPVLPVTMQRATW